MKVKLFYLVLIAGVASSLGACPASAAKAGGVSNLLSDYRKASERIQSLAFDPAVPYCVFHEYKPNTTAKARVAWQVISQIKDFVGGRRHLDQIELETRAGGVVRPDGVSVGGSLAAIYGGLIPYDADVYRTLRQTAEYDKANREKFETFAAGLSRLEGERQDALTAGGAAGAAAVAKAEVLRRSIEGLKRMAGQYGMGGLSQTVGYVQRDFRKQFDQRKMLNYGKCEGAAAKVVSISRAIDAEIDSVNDLVAELEEEANSLEAELGRSTSK